VNARLPLGLACVLVASAACGDNVLPVHGVSGGSRLGPRFWDAGDGARAFRVWFDHDLGVECQFELATDGRLRCLPDDPNAMVIDAFADAACTQPVLLAPACGFRPRYARGPSRATEACTSSEGSPVHEVGRVRTAPMIYRAFGDFCGSEMVPPAVRVHDVGPELAPEGFVAAELVIEAPDARLSPYALVADDGARLVDGIWDTERDGECSPRGGAAARCRPTAIALRVESLFSDAACAVPVAADVSDRRACHPPTAAWSGAAGYRELGAEVADASVHHMNSLGECVAWTTSGNERYWLEGPVIPDAAFAPLVEVLDGAGRVRASRWNDGDGQALAAADEDGFVDVKLDGDCSPRLFEKGYRCASDWSATWYETYADATCQTPALVWSDFPPPVVYVAHRRSDLCDPVEYDEARAIGAPMADTTAYYVRDTNAICAPQSLADDELLYALGGTVEVPALTR
jgi:hypothetical protein